MTNGKGPTPRPHEGEREADALKGSNGPARLTPRQLAATYRTRGWKPIPIPKGEKGPRKSRWQRVDARDAEFSTEVGGQNVGVQTGVKSNGLVDIDLDWPMAASVAALTMPEAPCFGRPGNPESHRLWIVTDKDPRTTKFSLAKATKLAKAMILEMRGNGVQTVFPGSVHPSGEWIGWTLGKEPEQIPSIGYDDLKRRCQATVVLTLAAEFYAPSGSRDDFCMCLAGVLMRMGFDPDIADEWIIGVADLAGDDEATSRGKAKQTREKMDDGEATTGLTTLLDLLSTDDPGVVKMLKDLCGGGGKKHAMKLAGDEIDISPGQMDAALEGLHARLATRVQDVRLFQRGGRLVMPMRLADDAADDQGVRRASGSLTLHHPGSAGMVSLFAKHARFIKRDHNGVPRPADPTTQLGHVFAEGRERWRMPALDAITGVPVFRPDGTIGECQGSCRLGPHATSVVARSEFGLRRTTSLRDQSRVPVVHRCGFLVRARA